MAMLKPGQVPLTEIQHGDAEPLAVIPVMQETASLKLPRRSSTLYSSKCQGEFELESKDPLSLKDNQGRVWDESGKCITPPDSTLQLKLLKGYLTEWYEWVSAQPDSAILGKP